MTSKLKVAIVGASGRVARLLVSQLARDTTHFAPPLAIVRQESQKEYWESQPGGITASCTDIAQASVADLAKVISGCDAVVFSAGATARGGAFTVDLDGAGKLIEACRLAKVSRYVLVSALKAQDRDFYWDTGLRDYYIAKMYSERELMRSGLEYTILQPGWLDDGEMSQGFAFLSSIDSRIEKQEYKIHRGDVAYAAVQCLLHPELTSGKSIPLLNGTESFDSIMKEL